MNHACIRRPWISAVLAAAGLLQIAAPCSIAQTIEDVTRAWEERRDGIDTLRCVTVGEQTYYKGSLDLELEGPPFASFPPGTKPPLPAEDYKSPYLYGVLYDFRKHRARVEQAYAMLGVNSTSFYPGDMIRTFDGIFIKSLQPKDVRVAPNAVQFHDIGPGTFGYGSEFPVLIACGYAIPQQLTRQEPYIMSTLPAEKLSIGGKSDWKGLPILVVRSATIWGR